MELLIVRHAIACEPDARRWPDDALRPLSPRGAARAGPAARGLRRLAPAPLRVWVSPLRRAKQTAAILARFADWPEGEECAQLLPEASPEALLAVLERAREKCQAVVGHQPGLGRLIAACLPDRAQSAAFELKKMGAALLSFPGGAHAGGGALLWLVPPRILRAAA
jgi:phosphohistidine phosphatase SixA